MRAARRSEARTWLTALALLAALLWSASAWAQTTSSTLKGTVRTSGGQPVADAMVQARSDSTGAVRTAVTDGEGRYRIELLSPGEWTVAVRLPDGQTSEARGIAVRLQQTAEHDITVGSVVTETVKVQAEAPKIDAQRVGSELRIGDAEIKALPVSGRLVTDLALLDAAVIAAPPGGYYGERGAVFVVNGQSGRSNSFLVDGLDNNDQVSGTTLNASFSQQVIREFVVLTHQYAPEFGRASGGILNIVTERGGNELAGELLLQGAASRWNEPGEFVGSLPDAGGEKDTSSRVQAGVRLGGPFVKDRAFYFGAYEHQASDEVISYTGTTRDGEGGGWTVAPSRSDSVFLKTDFNLGSQHFGMVRLSGDDREAGGINVGGNVTPEAGFDVQEKDLQLAASLTSVLSADLINEARILVGRSSFGQSARSDRAGVEHPAGIYGGNALNGQDRVESRLQLVDNLTWRVGDQTMKFGIDVTRSRTKVDVRFSPYGNFLYNTDVPYEPGDCGDLNTTDVPASDPDGDGTHDPIPCAGVVGVDDDGDGSIDEPGLIDTYPVVYTLIDPTAEATLEDTRYAVFAQSSWQLSPKFLLDYGWRYDLSTFELPRSAGVPSSIPNGGAQRDEDNIAPRIGFTWSPAAGGGFVVRGGAGMFYDKLVLAFPAVSAITSGTDIGLLFPQGLTLELTEDFVEQLSHEELRSLPLFLDELTMRFSTGTQLDTPYTVQYTLGAERSIGRGGILRADVVRALGYHMPLMRDLNPPLRLSPQGVPQHRDPTTGSIAAVMTEGRSWYTALDLGWRWQGKTLGYGVSYTWSKALDLGPDPLKGGIYLPAGPRLAESTEPFPPSSVETRGEKGRSDADRRHQIVLTGESGLPWFGLRMSGVVRAATGVAFNVTTGLDDNLDGIHSDRPEGVDRNTGEDTPLGPVNDLRRAVGRGRITSLSEPNYFQVDLRVGKPFLFGKKDRGQAELFMQVFNVLDRFNEGPIEGRVTSKNFGQAIGQAGPPRTLDFGIRAGF